MIVGRFAGVILLFGLLGCGAGDSHTEDAISREQDLLDNLVTAYYPFQQCTNGYIESESFDRELLFSGVVKYDLLEQSRQDAARFVPSSNSYIENASEPGLSEETQARLLLSGLITHGLSWNDSTSTKEKTLRLRALMAARFVTAKAYSMNCEPSEALNYWVDQVDHEYR